MKILTVLVFLIAHLPYLVKDIKAQIPCPLPAELIFIGAEFAPVPPTYFLLYTRKNPYYPQSVTGCYSNSNFNPSLKIYFILDGYNGSPNSEHSMYLKTAILYKEDCNVILVDWSKGATSDLVSAAKNALTVGKYIAEQLEFLKKCRNLDFKNFHIIGHSLGGQAAGFIGKYIKTGKIGRITGLDIVGVCFFSFPPKYKLHYSDASFVDVITTSASLLGLIMDQETGHVHFKPDGGHIGRGCGDHIGSIPNCTHNRAVYLFGASYYSDCLPVAYTCTDNDAFKRGECFDCGPNGENCAAMGYQAGKYANKVINGTRTMYLATTFTDYYFLYHYHVEVTLAAAPKTTVEIGKLVLIINGQFKLLNEDLYIQLTTDQFQSGTTYIYLIVSAYNTDNIQQFEFLWYTTVPKHNNRLYVKCVKIVPMNNLQANRSNLTKFGTTNGQLITPGSPVQLTIGNSC